MNPTADNILVRAIDRNELEKFLAGEPPYFFDAKSDNEEPQHVTHAFDVLVVPYWTRTKDADFPRKFVAALFKLLNSYPDKNRAIYVAHDWIWYYTYCIHRKSGQSPGQYGDLFEVDFSGVASLLKSLLESNRQALINDERWAGASWNSNNGMWGPLLKTSENVRDKLGGPDFVPNIS